MNELKIKQRSKDVLITILLLTMCTLLSFVFVNMHVRRENIIMIYLIGVLFIIIETKKLFWGITASFLSIITFNYFFTQPLYTLRINDPNYIITIIIFLIVSIIAGILMQKMQEHAFVSLENEQRTLALYEISKSYVHLSKVDAIFMHNIHSLQAYQNIICVIYYFEGHVDTPTLYQENDTKGIDPSEIELAKWCYQHNCSCGFGTSFYTDSKWSYHPLLRGTTLLGVYAMYHDHASSYEDQLFTNTLLSQMVMAIEREQLYRVQEQNRIEIEKEKLRNNLLRSISHDLRTPLTGIAGSSSLILENYENLDKETTINLLRNISSDAQWLTQLVENLLDMTRIQDGKLLLSKQKEVVDDIILEAMQRCEPRKGKHTICVHLPKEVHLVEMDGRLIIQVLVNYLDNAIKHTQEDSTIEIRFYRADEQACFEVMDNGAGIEENIIDSLFDSFVTTKQGCVDAKRGIGLGLSICKAIIEAHDGTVYAQNRIDHKGAIFGFRLPDKEEQHE